MTELAGRRFTLGLVSVLLGVLGVAAVVDLSRGGQGGTAVPPAPGTVVLVGAPGLSWSDIDPQTTPALWDMVRHGASGTLVVRGTHELTCPADGWLTLSAGQRASADIDGNQDCAGSAGLAPAAGSAVPSWVEWQTAADRRPLGARLGTLSAALSSGGECVHASGPLAGLGAATPDGTVPAADPGCRVVLMGTPAVDTPARAAEADRAVRAVLAERGPDTTVIVAGLSDRDGRPGLRAVLVTGPGIAPGALTSGSTRQPGMVQTTDLTATLLALVGVDRPPQVAGVPVAVLPAPVGASREAASDAGGAADGAAEAVAADAATTARAQDWRDLAGGAAAAKALPVRILGGGLVVALAALGLAAWLDRRRQRARGRAGPTPYPGVRTALVGSAALAVPSAAFLAGLLPWWRAGGPTAAATVAGYVAVLLVGVAVHVAAGWGGPWRRHPLGPVAVVCALTVAVLGCDVILGGRLGLVSLLGVQPVVGGRFHGMGNVGFGIIASAAVVLAGCVASLLRRSPGVSTAAVVAVGLAVTVVDGAPMWGADFGGVPAMLAATGVLALAAACVRLTVQRATLLGLLAAGGAALILVVDWLRPAAERTHLGAFVQSLLDGEGGAVVARKLDQSLGILVRYPVSWAAVVVLVLVVWALAAPASSPGRLAAPLLRVPLLRDTTVALVVLWVVGWALNDSGIAIVGVGLLVAIAAALAIGPRIAPVAGAGRPLLRDGPLVSGGRRLGGGPAARATRRGTAAPDAAGQPSPDR